MISNLRQGNLDNAWALKERFSLPDEVLSGSQAKEAAKEGMSLALSKGQFEYALEFKDRFSLTAEQVAKSAENAFAECMLNYYDSGHYDYYINIAINIEKEFSLKEEAVREIALDAVHSCLLYYHDPQKDDEYLDYALEIREKFHIPQEAMSNAKIQDAARIAIIRDLKEGYIEGALRSAESYSVAPEVLSSLEMQKFAEAALFIALTERGNIPTDELKEKFSLTQQAIRQTAREAIDRCLFDYGEESSENKNYLCRAADICEKFLESKEEVANVLIIKVLEFLSMENMDGVHGILDNFSNEAGKIVSDPEVQKAAVRIIVDKLTLYLHFNESNADYNDPDFDYDYVGRSLAIADRFRLSGEIFASSEIQKAGKNALIVCLNNGFVENANSIREKFNIVVSPQELIDSNPEAGEMLLKLKDISPEFYNQALKSTDITFSIFTLAKNPEKMLDVIKNNSFLIDAVSENPRFGSKLLVTYTELDGKSRENIAFLFKAKKDILEESPEIDPETCDFRVKMQEKLKSYGSNEKILERLESLGINTEEWLGYSKTEYFSLDSGNSNLEFSETVSTPINRIKETMSSYAYRVKEVIKEYKGELESYKVQNTDSKEISQAIEKMENELSKAKTEGNEKKMDGIEAGILSLKEKMKKTKEVPLWDKVIGDINAFDRLKNDIFASHENLIRAEEKFKDCASDKSRAAMDIVEAKRALAKAKEGMKEKFNLLEKRIEEFRKNLVPVLSPALGKERADSLRQEIDQGLGEQFNHYDADRSTLANLFSEKSDKEREKLESRPMSIFVWARNPDVDLYQGNYSPCCISIESGYYANGAESTISDYSTDLGIQIVNICDETKNEPVTAAWCWVGEDRDGNCALVVDNIESNTLYSANYSEQLTDKLFEYLHNYAAAIGAKKVVLGKANNDLPAASRLAKMDSDERSYTKAGGYNRKDGYYLEAEDVGVKVIWQESKKKKQKKGEKEGPKTELYNCEFGALTEENFADVIRLEEGAYRDEDLNQGEELIGDIKKGKGSDYSVVLTGEKEEGEKEVLGYAVAVEDETDEGKPCVYLEDIVVVPEAQGRGFGWELIKKIVEKLKNKAVGDGKPVLFDMHLRSSSQGLIEKHKDDLKGLGLMLVDEALVSDYYNENEDALYQVYEVSG